MFWTTFFLLLGSGATLWVCGRKGWVQSLIRPDEDSGDNPGEYLAAFTIFAVLLFGILTVVALILWGVPRSETAATLLTLVFLGALGLFVFGVFKPGKAAFWSSNLNAPPSRKQVLGSYGVALLTLVVLIAMAAPQQATQSTTPEGDPVARQSSGTNSGPNPSDQQSDQEPPSTESGSPDNRARQTAGSDGSNESSQDIVSMGQVGQLSVPGDDQGPVPVAATEKALDKLTEAVTKNDNYGITELVMIGAVYTVESQTKVRVLDHGYSLAIIPTKTKFRVLGGEHVGKIGWVPYEFISPVND